MLTIEEGVMIVQCANLLRWSSVALVLAYVGLAADVARAQWVANGSPVTNAIGAQTLPTAVSDGVGGAIFVWQDQRSGTFDIYMQRMSRDGVALWTSGGVPICTAPGDQRVQQRVNFNLQQVPSIVPDGAGGAIVAWQDRRAGTWDVYAQRVNASGTPLWTPDGVALSVAAGDQQDPTIATDGPGGAIVTWRDNRPGSNGMDIYAQRVSAAGAPTWTANGVAICAAVGDQQLPTIAPDASGGAYIAWYDFRSDPRSDVYANHVSAAGTIAAGWAANGNAVCTAIDAAPTFSRVPVVASDGSGGALIVWLDGRTPVSLLDIYAQRMAPGGAALWTANGVPVCTAVGDQQLAQIVADGTGGAIVTWYDFRSDPNSDMFIQRLSSSGSALWTPNGVQVTAQPGDQRLPSLIPDGSGGAILTWVDGRNTVPPTFAGLADVYAQRYNASGAPQWTAGGVAICTDPSNQAVPVLATDGSGGAVIGWMDNRNGAGNSDVYAVRVSAAGVTPAANLAPVLASIGDLSVNEGSLLSFTASASDGDAPYQTVSFTIDPGGPAGASITPGGSFVWTPTEAQGPGVYPITVRVTDDGLPPASDFETISITVIEVNEPPVLDAIGDKTVAEGTLLDFTAGATDTDLPPNALSYSLALGSPPATGAAITTGGNFTWTPAEAQGPGVYPITIIVSDGVGSDEELIQVTVVDANEAPTLDAIGDRTVAEGSLLQFTATAIDPDLPSQTLAFSLDTGAPAGAAITPGGVFTWTPTSGQVGTHAITIRVADDGSPILDDFETIEVVVLPTNAPGSISGVVTASCPSPATGLLGVTIDLFEQGSGDLVGTAVTNDSGSYAIGDVPPGDYTVTIVVPLSHQIAAPEVPVTVNGGNVVVSFDLTCRAIPAAPRSIGFWKHQVGVHTGGNGAAQVSASALCGFLDLIEQHFNSNAVNEVVVYIPPASGTCADKLDVAKALLNLKGSAAMIARGRQQLMALLLNVAGGYIGLMQQISADGATVSQAITYCDNLIDNPSGDHEKAKTIADLINNSQPVPAGMIPLDTANIAYRAVASFRAGVNPSSGPRTFSLVLSNATRVSLFVYDVRGRIVSRVHEGVLPAGPHALRWGGEDSAGRAVAAGCYFAVLKAPGVERTLKLVEVR